MSIDADYKLRFSHPTKDELVKARNYLRRKLRFYEHWSAAYRAAENKGEFLKRLGCKRENTFVCARYEFGKIVKCKHGYSMAVDVSRNEVTRNVWISGEDGELADLLEKHPSLEVSGHMRKEGGKPAQIIGYRRWNSGESAKQAFMYTREAMSLITEAALSEPPNYDIKASFDAAFQQFKTQFEEFQAFLERRNPSLLMTGREPFED